MATTIAVSGKGGSGKTTVAAMIIRCLVENGPAGSILGVDADPNSCLALALGVEVAGTIAEIREQARAKQADSGTDRLRTFEYGIQQAITEANGFDLLTMGRPEGPDCYCAANNMLRQFMDKLNSQYSYLVLDNEAGMEHLSRRTTNNVDLLCIMAEATAIGLVTIRRIVQLTKELPIVVRRLGVVWNRTASPPQQRCELEAEGIETYGCVPDDEAVFRAALAGKSIFELDAENPALRAVRAMLAERLQEVHNKQTS